MGISTEDDTDIKNKGDKESVRKKAYAILELEDGADRESIENRYLLLLRKHKASVRSGLKPDSDFNQVTEAYNFLTGYSADDENYYEPSPFFKRLGINPKKAGNWFSYNKWYFVYGILAIVLAVSVIKAVTRPRPDFRLAFLGEIVIESTAGIESRIEEKTEGIEYAYAESVAGFEEGDPYRIMPQKEAALIAAGGIDVFIVDKAKYEGYAEKGLFISLDDYIAGTELERFSDAALITQTETDSSGHQFGIDVTDSSLLAEFNIYGERLIACISSKSKQAELALDVLKLLAD